jgi:hypothetical protein
MDTTHERKIERIATYLRGELARRGSPLYVKSRFMTDDLGLSAREIGTAMGRLADRDGGLTVERWANSGGTTWCVAAPDGTTDTDS